MGRYYDYAATLEAVRIREPLPIGKLGTIFWAPTYTSVEGSPQDWETPEDLQRFCDQDWEEHFGLPRDGSVSFVIQLPEPLRSDGFEDVSISVDYLMGHICVLITVDWNQDAAMNDLGAFPKELIILLKKLLLEWAGETMQCHYSALPEEGNPKEIYIDFRDCKKLPTDADQLLTEVAGRISVAV